MSTSQGGHDQRLSASMSTSQECQSYSIACGDAGVLELSSDVGDVSEAIRTVYS